VVHEQPQVELIMSVLLILLAFMLILISVAVQLSRRDSGVKFAVTWTLVIAALFLGLFSAKVYFT
jgi:hypothetical protein